MENNFVHLNLHTEYSLLEGVNSIDSFLTRAKELGMNSLAVTDYANMFCAIEFYEKAKKMGIKPIIGLELPLYEKEEQNIFTLTLLAKDYEGYKNLVKLASELYKKKDNGELRISKGILKEYSKGLIALSSSMKGEIGKAILMNFPSEKLDKIVDEYIKIFSKENFYLEIQANELPETKIINDKFYEIAKLKNIELVATNNVHYVDRDGYELQDIVICIQSGWKLKDKNRKRAVSKELYLKSKEEMQRSLDERFHKAIENTNYIASLCNLEIEFGNLQFPYYEVPNQYLGMDEYLKSICYENIKKIYKENLTKDILERLEYELSVIIKMGYSGYFIVVWDFIAYAKRNGIPVGPGRGSAAGSLVAYCLGITMIDPIRYNLLFERFLNPERISMPDIDIDICRERRDELIDYVVHKYGRERVAHIITFGRMKARAAIRDIGRVLDIDLKKIDRLSKLVSSFQTLEKTLKENVEVAKLYTTDIELQKVIDLSIRIENKIRHVSTHAAGILITKEDLDRTVPIYLDEKEGVIATQYQMKELEDLGLLKIDFLGLKNLSNIQRTIDYIKKYKNIDIELYKIPLDDKKVFEMLSQGDSTGVFQLESTGIRKIMKRLKPNKLEDIVALLALYRPGPLQSGMVDDFINRKNGKEKIEYPHKNLEIILKETYGVILYQEQVMKIASYMANYSLGEADLLRRAMGKKNFAIMRENREKFIQRAVENNYTEEKADEIFELIDKFAGYGFNKSHSVAYAMISYWTAYLKAHYPAFYFAAIMTSEISETGDVAYYFNDAKEHRISIYPPNVNTPSAYFEIKNDGISYSLAAIKNLGLNLAKKIVEDYEKHGAYTKLDEFVLRNKKNGMNKRALEALILSGALDELEGNRKEKFLSIDKVLDFVSKAPKTDEIQQMNLFGAASKTIDKFVLSNSEDFSLDEKLTKEKEFLGFYLSSHPLDKYRDIVTIFSINKLSEIDVEESKVIKTFGTITGLKKVLTKKDEQMALFSILCYDRVISCIAFPKTYEKFLEEIIEKKTVYVEGKIQIDEYKGEKTTKLLIEKIISLDKLYDYPAKKLFVLIEEEDRYKYSRLRELINSNKGNTDFIFAIKNKNEKRIQNTGTKVKLNREFLEQLVELMGIEKIKIQM
ncbi:DNA polymerase III subunit alpha [Fusobacterium periodonticum]|uniref:DNA polymerase III subunit alpha n=1 Tax=Fusobacterium periodonticum TaxID=860 RepID=UPI001957ADC4|nr:DNA polymerase III subunit alpha [Fusobacterium periodonticum]VTX69831.1 DNA polymerase III subunit alpha [Fusobacterium periodonticum]